MTDPMARPGNDDPSIEQAAERVAETWQRATPDKDADADADDFRRMREGFGDLADRVERAPGAGGQPPTEAGVTDDGGTGRPGSAA